MPSLNDLRLGKAPAPVEAAQPPSPGLRIKVSSSRPESDERSSSRPPVQKYEVPTPTEDERLLGTENRSDVIPYFPPNPTEEEKVWQEASLLPRGSLGIVISQEFPRIAWLASSRPGMPPLLIQPFPILGLLQNEMVMHLECPPDQIVFGDLEELLPLNAMSSPSAT